MPRLLLVLAAVSSALAGCVPRPVDVTDLQPGGGQPVTVPGISSAAAAATAVLNGSVSTPASAVLAPGSVIRVRIEDVSAAGAPAVVVAEDSFVPIRQLPLPFSLAYDPVRIDVSRRYSVRAEIRDAAGTLLWTTTTQTPVFTQGGPVDGVEVVVEPVPN